MKSKLTLIPIKKQSIPIVKDWFLKLNKSLRDEALETIKEECITHELGGIIEIKGRYYACVTTMYKKEIKKANMEREINKAHKLLKSLARNGTPIEIDYLYIL